MSSLKNTHTSQPARPDGQMGGKGCYKAGAVKAGTTSANAALKRSDNAKRRRRDKIVLNQEVFQ